MKILFASDSFKGSLTSGQTISLLNKAAKEVFGDVETTGLPIADGGEGTVQAVVQARNGEIREIQVSGPLGLPVMAFYGKLSETDAILEMASASGLPLLKPEERNPLYTSTYGTGELVKAVLKEGFTNIAIAIGGSATNDGGMGFAAALGVRFYDNKGRLLEGKGENLEKVDHIDISELNPQIQKVNLTVMTDVRNPLSGENGATLTFGEQKGATPAILQQLENGMENYRKVIIRQFGIDPNDIPGSGAAGGLGAALTIFFHAQLKSGIETVLDLIRFDEYLQGCDLVISGEGRTDWQSSFGKVMQGVGDRAAAYGIPVVALCGSLGKNYESIYEHGVDSILTTVDAPMSLEKALEQAELLYYQGAVRMFRMVRAGIKIGSRQAIEKI
ncbi:glycerate kinase [Clostridiales bacterium COT073_COT-073]|nr:glycerate kinase [Clostridiales bacterium COT073_COT-073]